MEQKRYDFTQIKKATDLKISDLHLICTPSGTRTLDPLINENQQVKYVTKAIRSLFCNGTKVNKTFNITKHISHKNGKMANFEQFIKRVLRLEGGYVNHPNDNGGCTNKGITLSVFRAEYGYDLGCNELKSITDEQAGLIYKKNYWDVCMADDIVDINVANLLVDFAINSGCKRAIKAIQGIIGVKVDGYMGKVTLGAINGYNDQVELFNLLMEYRVNYYHSIVDKNPSQKVFLKGWLNRLNEWVK